jgi:G3E family GTPase
MVTVVDAVNLLNDYSSHDFLRDRGETLGEEDERTLVHLLTDQIEFADVVILNTGFFDFDKAHEHPMWAKELYGFADHVPETEEYGVASFVYRARAPFDPQMVFEVLNGALPGVIRAKGHFWVATRPDWVAKFSLAGALSSVKPLGTWWASVPRDRWPNHAGARSYMQAHWTEPFGDRRQELVFIGAGIDWPALKARLDACLLDVADEGDLGRLQNLADPFPRWRTAEEAA